MKIQKHLIKMKYKIKTNSKNVKNIIMVYTKMLNNSNVFCCFAPHFIFYILLYNALTVKHFKHELSADLNEDSNCI